MDSKMCIMFVILVGFAVFGSSNAYTFTVGGKQGWVVKPSEGYDQWSSRNRFLVNDTLVFKYNKDTDSVLVVNNKQDYDTCNITSPLQKLEGGDSSFKIDKSGPIYFISGNQTNCQNGQKLAIVVISPKMKSTSPPSPAAPSPSGGGSGSTPPTGSIAPSPSGGSGGGGGGSGSTPPTGSIAPSPSGGSGGGGGSGSTPPTGSIAPSPSGGGGGGSGSTPPTGSITPSPSGGGGSTPPTGSIAPSPSSGGIAPTSDGGGSTPSPSDNISPGGSGGAQPPAPSSLSPALKSSMGYGFGFSMLVTLVLGSFIGSY